VQTTCLLGAIADDYTGGSDLAGMLRERGVRTVQLFGIPEDLGVAEGYQAVVLCLKSRSIAAPEACDQSLAALEALGRLGARQIQFKYCSTFDSTERGNIGPVTDALMEAMGVESTIAVPALPVNGRTQYLGHLFVGSQLLSDSPMRNHPLNPMTDSNLVRHLQAQTKRRVGLIDLHTLRRGAAAAEPGIALVDAISEADLDTIAEAFVDLPLITGGSGLGMALPRVWRNRGLLSGSGKLQTEPALPGRTLILSGSCSAATLKQLDELENAGYSSVRVDVARLMENAPAELDRLVTACANTDVAAVRSSAPASERVPDEQASTAIEALFGQLAKHLVESRGVTSIIVAGGETSGAVVNALGIKAVEILDTIDPGVPALKALGNRPLRLALKSGNFGAPDFFLKTMRKWNE
jgi:3-dehydrotetronate 4-kinase